MSIVTIGRPIEPEEVTCFAGELYRNEAPTGDVFYLRGVLGLDSRDRAV